MICVNPGVAIRTWAHSADLTFQAFSDLALWNAAELLLSGNW